MVSRLILRAFSRRGGCDRPSVWRPRRPPETGAIPKRSSGLLRAIMFRPAILLLLGTALLGTSCKTFSSRVISDPLPAAARLQAGGSIKEEVDRLAQPLIASGEIYSMAIGVLAPDGSAWNFGYGLSGRPGEAQSPTGDDIFQVGSLSKLFVASVLAILVDEGQLHYEDTVRSILPPEIPLNKDIGDLTLQELVTHTGGLPRQPMGPTQMCYFARYLFTGHNLYGYIDKAYLYEYLRTCHIKPKGQREYVYSNIGVALLAHLIEIKTGRSLPDLVEEKICRPLNMSDTTFYLNAGQQKRLAVGHVGDQPKFIQRNTPTASWDMGEIMRATGGLYSTVNDLLIFARANLGLLNHPLEPLLAGTHQVQLKTPDEDVALGWLVNHFDNGRVTLLYKHGMVSGYNGYIGLNVDKRIAVVVLSSNFNWDDKIGHNLLLRLSEGLPARQPELSQRK
jgi:CubicO group peptidase (beta-lactamase class C family)